MVDLRDLVLAATMPSDTNDLTALYAPLAAVVVSLVGGAVAIITSKRVRSDPAPDALPRAMSDLYEHVVEERILWEARARRLGWKEGDK